MEQKKVLCFTPSHNRHKMLRGCIRDVASQTYPNIVHAVNIAYDKDVDIRHFPHMYDDLQRDNLFISYNLNVHNHFNYVNAIKSCPYFLDFDIYIKIDDDDMYKSGYVEAIVSQFQDDIATTKVKYYLNGHRLITGLYDNFGANPEGTDYHMPMTLAFNRKALYAVLNVENPTTWSDLIWRREWEKNGLKHHEVNNRENIIWYVHGENISTSSFLKK